MTSQRLIDGFGAQGEYDASRLSLLVAREALVSRGENPLVIYKQSSTHWNSAYRAVQD